jgi:hypothetical protein
VVAFNGDLIEIAGVVEPGRPPKLRLQIVPPATVARERTRFRILVTANDFPVTGAVVRLAGEEVTTGPRGKARLTRTFKRPGKRRASASRDGFRRVRTTVRVATP